ncbi:MAG: DPP IV N-terminal domain-containing protein [Myxococcota bacterium]
MPDHRPVTVDDVVQLPAPGLGGPSSFRLVGDRLWWIGPDPARSDLVRSLWSLDLDDPAATPVCRVDGRGHQAGGTLEDQLRRERLRERGEGVTGAQQAARGRTLLVKRGGDVLVERSDDAQPLGTALRPLPGGQVLDPALSPDGRHVAFVRDAEVHVGDLAGDLAARQITSGARGTGRTHGLAEFVAQEEMRRHTGLWWSRDARHIAYVEVDETHIPVWRIPYEGAETPSWEDHRYPFAGADNARVALHVVPREGGAPVRMQLDAAGPWEYLVRVAGLADGALLAQVQDRRQQRLTALRLDPETGAAEVVLVEEPPPGQPYLELDTLSCPLSDGGFLWGSERSGYRHLYRVGADGVVTAVTSGDWLVDELVAVDEANGTVYVLATADGPLERHLYAVPLAGGPPRRLTAPGGTHDALVDVASGRFVDHASALGQPPRTTVRQLADGHVVREIDRAADRDPRLHALRLPAPELHTVTGRSGETLHVAVYRPDTPPPWPTVVAVYGGPHAQRVTDSWDVTADMRAQLLRAEGFAVVKADNRGSARRGVRFQAALAGEPGRVEIEDQADVVRALAERGLVDPARVGITGGSYGGYLTIMALLREPDVFRCGVAAAPVTHWDGYDTHYTERYLGLPADNPEGYAASSVLQRVDALRGALMLVHGMRDENVHFRHTGRLVNALVAADKDFVLQAFPDERHMPRGPRERRYLEQRILAFFRAHLGG